jgi:hypothetical protein
MKMMRANPLLPGLSVTGITRSQKQTLLQTSHQCVCGIQRREIGFFLKWKIAWRKAGG